MINTQAFAQLCDTSKKTVIYYDQIGLLKPAFKKDLNRFYKPKQVLTFQKIVLLKSFGLSLKEIKKYLYQNKALLKLFLNRKTDLEKQRQVLEKRINKLKEFSTNLKQNKPMVVPKIKTVKPHAIYGMKKTGRYVDIAGHQKELFEKIGDKKYSQVGLTIFFDNQYSPQDAKMITGALIKSKKPKKIPGVELIKVPSYRTVSYTHIGSYKYMSYMWQFLDKFILENKLKLNPQIPCREFYILGSHVEKNEDNLITELQIPIT